MAKIKEAVESEKTRYVELRRKSIEKNSYVRSFEGHLWGIDGLCNEVSLDLMVATHHRFEMVVLVEQSSFFLLKKLLATILGWFLGICSYAFFLASILPFRLCHSFVIGLWSSLI